MDIFLFYLFAGIALAGAMGVIAFRRVFYSAISLITCLGALAVSVALLPALGILETCAFLVALKAGSLALVVTMPHRRRAPAV